jgi:glycosyltransferase involved in cell wall biosynthesis
MKLVLSVNSAWNVYNFRQGLINGLVEAGHQVTVLAPSDAFAERLVRAGYDFRHIDMDGASTNPIKDLGLLWRYLRSLHDIKPDVFLGFTIKPNVYGSLASRWLGIQTINNIAGLGSTLMSQSRLAGIVERLYKASLASSSRVFFQNDNDMARFVQAGIVREGLADRLPGSGVDLARFNDDLDMADPYVQSPSTASASDPASIRFIMVCRMLRPKGVAEYLEAARRIRAVHPQARFTLLGPTDDKNPAAYPLQVLAPDANSAGVEYVGATDDVRPYIQHADVVVLPSYYPEGVPRVLLEAAALGKPIVTTDTAGCRDAVQTGLSGLLVAPRDSGALHEAMNRLIGIGVAGRQEMGRAGRAHVEQRFSERFVVERYLNALEAIAKTLP